MTSRNGSASFRRIRAMQSSQELMSIRTGWGATRRVVGQANIRQSKMPATPSSFLSLVNSPATIARSICSCHGQTRRIRQSATGHGPLRSQAVRQGHRLLPMRTEHQHKPMGRGITTICAQCSKRGPIQGWSCSEYRARNALSSSTCFQIVAATHPQWLSAIRQNRNRERS